MQHQYYQRSSMSAPPRYIQPSLAPPGQHIRRQPHPRSVHLETLPERDVEEADGSELEVGTANVAVGRNFSTRPTSMSNPYSSSYDAPTYHFRAVTTPAYSQYARPHSRRLSSYPHRSSPLAGPSVALTQDGTLTNITAVQRPRSLLSVCESAYNSPSPSANPSLENLTIDAPLGETKENIPTPPPTPPAQAKQTPSKRLSLGLKKLTSLPSLPKRISASIPSPPTHSYSTSANSKGKSREDSSAAAEAAAPIPRVPVWSTPGHVPTRTGSRAPMPFRPHSPNNMHLHPNSAALNRRGSQVSLAPSMASVQSVQSNRSSHRRSMAVSANPVPSTSRDPELNWLSTAAPPKFSRLSLKAEGVVMPVSAKEMRRRSSASLNRTGSVRSVTSVYSTVSTTSRISEGGRLTAETKRSLTEDVNTLRKLEGNAHIHATSSRPTTPITSASTPVLSSLSEEDISDSDTVSPPYPPFFHNSSKNSSASSISSSLGTTASGEESDILETPSLSRTSSVTEDEEGEGGLPRTPPATIASAGSVGVVSEATKDLHIRGVSATGAKESVPVVKTAEAVTIKVVGVRASMGHKKEGRSLDGKVERKGTLKKVWGRVFGGRSASMPALKV